MKKRAFTLIELMVVMTTISIVAAVLFPVFAHSRLAAAKATDIANLRQMTLAHGMYWADYDDRMVTSWTYGLPGDFTFMVQPYIKNREIMLSPGRTISFQELAVACDSANLVPGGVDNPFGEPSVWGYGYNTGHDWDDGTGLVTEVDNEKDTGGNGDDWVTFAMGGKPITVQIRPWVKRGITTSEVASSSLVAMLGNTGDRIVQGLGRTDITPTFLYPKIGRIETTCDHVRLKGFPTWGNAIHVAFVDGHTKLIHLDLETLQWGMLDQDGEARVEPKLLPNACMYVAAYDGSNNPVRCATGDAR